MPRRGTRSPLTAARAAADVERDATVTAGDARRAAARVRDTFLRRLVNAELVPPEERARKDNAPPPLFPPTA